MQFFIFIHLVRRITARNFKVFFKVSMISHHLSDHSCLHSVRASSTKSKVDCQRFCNRNLDHNTNGDRKLTASKIIAIPNNTFLFIMSLQSFYILYKLSTLKKITSRLICQISPDKLFCSTSDLIIPQSSHSFLSSEFVLS